MELLIPSFAVILIAVAIAFYLMPHLAPVVLTGGSAVLLLGAVYVHYSKFGVMEYERATWQYNLRRYSTWVIMGMIFLGAVGFWAMNKGVGDSVLPAVVTNTVTSPAMPSITAPIVGGGMNHVMRTASSRIKELMRHGRISLD
jgi:hypothetical protein